jgi:hypothetical protein
MINRLQRAAVTEGPLAPGRSDRPKTRPTEPAPGTVLTSLKSASARCGGTNFWVHPCAVLAWLMA